MALTLTFTLDDDQEIRAYEIACRHFGHVPSECPDTPSQHVQEYGAWVMAQHIEMTERQLAEEAAREGLQPFFTGP
ncbi:hypothetical protein GMA7_5 [Gordonia phage GMA7]|uniref:Uncharacterized protein n=1 Tax=Gordonia phage GMA7 TaxID=1647286 RepID=A0A0K0N6T9_9CAUD|nr:hypothetical protein AU104_gp005 [Gordonia phage GMA7]AKJ72442.1 hypothetical protein GMA7_5 [Gordonia phage GMA7]